jgi:hypothetical protein
MTIRTTMGWRQQQWGGGNAIIILYKIDNNINNEVGAMEDKSLLQCHLFHALMMMMTTTSTMRQRQGQQGGGDPIIVLYSDAEVTTATGGAIQSLSSTKINDNGAVSAGCMEERGGMMMQRQPSS